MTFDARKATPSSASGKQNALFAAVTLITVCGVFFAVLSLPKPAATPLRAPDAVLADKEMAMPALPGERAEAYYVALGRADARAQAELRRRLSRAGGQEDAALARLILDHAGEVMQAHAGELAKADTRHLDHILDLAHERLRQASRKRSKWCSATHYAELRDIEFSNPTRLNSEFAAFEVPMREFAFEAMAGVMVAVEDAQAHPVPRGALTRADEAALQGMVMSIMADPDVLPLMVSLQAEADPQKALKGVNVCDLGATAVMAAKTLPQETKGRVLAEFMGQFEKTGPEGAFRAISF